MYKIQLNSTGTHFLSVTKEHLQTIERYSLFRDLIDSNGYVDESVLDKLKLNIRSLIGSATDKVEELLHIDTNIINNEKMKA